MDFTATDVITKAAELGFHRINVRCEWTSPEGNTCASGYPYGSEGNAVHKIGGRRLCGFHSPYDTNAENLARFGYEEGIVIMEPVIEPAAPLEIKFVKVGKGAAVHAALVVDGRPLTVTLCKRVWTTPYTHTGESFGVTCKPCLRTWETLRKAADIEAATLKTTEQIESPAVFAPQTPLNTPQTTVEPVIDPVAVPATTEAAEMVLPRRVPTPSALDALNLTRHIGEWVRVRNHGLAVLRKVIPARPGGRPGVVVDFPGWGDCECSLAEVMLSPANAL